MTHPLTTPWTFYCTRPLGKGEKPQDYEKTIQKIFKVTTVEEFWGVYTHLHKPTELKAGTTLQIFRNDSRAMREDNDNITGGTFQIKLSKDWINDRWEHLLLDLVRGSMHPDIVGAVVHFKPRSERIVIWNKTSNDLEIKISIVKELINTLSLPLKHVIYGPNGPEIE